MNLLIFALGSAGDVHPFVGLGKALSDRNHRVTVFASPVFQDLVEKAGLEFRGLGSEDDFRRVMANPGVWEPTKALKILLRESTEKTYEPIMAGVEELHIPGETVMVGSSLAFGARSAQEKYNIPLVTAHLAPSLFFSAYRTPRLHRAPLPEWAPRWWKSLFWEIAYKATDHLILPKLNAFRAKHGLSPVKRVLGDWWNSPDRVLGLFPEWFGPVQPDWPHQLRLTGFPLYDESGITPLEADLEAFLEAGTPPVVFTPGSAMLFGQRFFKESVEICRRLDVRGVFLSRHEENIPANLPKTIHYSGFAPLSQLLPRSSAMVYHGGIGTCSQALQAGVPHFIQHLAYDQLDNLSRVKDLGVGDGIGVKQYRAKKVAPMLGRLLADSAVLARCDEVASWVQPKRWTQEACDVIEEAARLSRSY